MTMSDNRKRKSRQAAERFGADEKEVTLGIERGRQTAERLKREGKTVVLAGGHPVALGKPKT